MHVYEKRKRELDRKLDKLTNYFRKSRKHILLLGICYDKNREELGVATKALRLFIAEKHKEYYKALKEKPEKRF